MFKLRLNCTTPGMAQDHHQSHAKTLHGKLNTSDLGRTRHVSCYTNNEQILDPLVENQFNRYARVRAAENCRKQFLVGCQFYPR